MRGLNVEWRSGSLGEFFERETAGREGDRPVEVFWRVIFAARVAVILRWSFLMVLSLLIISDWRHSFLVLEFCR